MPTIWKSLRKNTGTVDAILAAQLLLVVLCFGILSLSCGRNCDHTKTGPPSHNVFSIHTSVQDPGVTIINLPP